LKNIIIYKTLIKFLQKIFIVLPLLFEKQHMFHLSVVKLKKLDDESTYSIRIVTKISPIDFCSSMPFLKSKSEEDKKVTTVSSSFEFLGKYRQQVVETMEKLDYKFCDDNDDDDDCSENSFTLSRPYSIKEKLLIDATIVCDDYDPFDKWMPFIDFSGEFEESMPMGTSFTFPADKKDEVIKTLKSHGYAQT
jgi:hypothetical protein